MISKALTSLIVSIVRLYQYLISPLLGPSCRFYPSCSSYSIEAIETYGAVKGSYLSIRRILKCHPWHSGGSDPVPQRCAMHSPATSIHQNSGPST